LYARADPINVVDPSGAFGEELGVVTDDIVDPLIGQPVGPFRFRWVIWLNDWNDQVQKMQNKLDEFDSKHPDNSSCQSYEAQAPGFDSRWFDGDNGKKQKNPEGPKVYRIEGGPLAGAFMIGNDLNYYFQGMIAKHYHLSEEDLILLVWGWKSQNLVNGSGDPATPSDNALLAARTGWEQTPGEPDDDTSLKCLIMVIGHRF
jgi:hypothetical protein